MVIEGSGARLVFWATMLSAGMAFGQTAPLADHHQHLFSPAVAQMISTPESPVKPITARDLIPLLDAAGIKRAVVLSVAYLYGSPSRTFGDEYERVKAENDWTSQQVGLYPGRLIGFCGLNPLKDYAQEELARCSKDPRLHGLKLHIGNSAVDYTKAQDVARVREVFRAANRYGMPIVVHMRASVSRKLPYGRDAAMVFLNELLPAAPDVPVQIAHMAGAGGWNDDAADEALGVFVEAIARGDARTKHLSFDVTTVAQGLTTERAAALAKRIRQVGVQRVLYGSDAASGGNLAPKEGWAAFRALPLTEEEFRTVAGNVPDYLK